MVRRLILALALGAVACGATLHIGFYHGPGTSDNLDEFYTALEDAARSLGEYDIHNLTAEEVRELKHDSFDVVVFPGGSGNGQANAIGEAGLQAVRDFVSGGRAYIGTCGGAFLGISHLFFYGDPPPATREPWDRGHGVVEVEFNQKGVDELKLDPKVYLNKNVTITYWQGPIVGTDSFPSSVNLLSFFRTEIHSHHPNETKGEMINTPAMTSTQYGKGRVALNSPHPELEPHHYDIYAGELAWVTQQ